MTKTTASALRTAGVYVLVGVLWILVSDRALLWLVGDPIRAQALQTPKGWFFILASGAVLFAFVHRQFAGRDRLLEDLADERERMNLLVEGASDFALCLLDAKGCVATWNSGAEHITGWRAQEIIGRHMRHFCAPADVAAGRPEQALAEAARTNHFGAEVLRVRRDGTAFWASIRITALRHAGGTLRGFAMATRDISSQKRAEAALLESERLFRALFEQAGVGIAQMAPDGRVLRVNAHFCEMLGRSEAELRRAKFADYVPPEDLAPDAVQLRRCLAGEIEFYRTERRYVRADGRVMWAHLSITLVREQDGVPAYFITVAQDITARRAAEDALSANAAQYHVLFASNPLPMFVYDLETLKVLAVNEATLSNYGYTCAEFLGMTICDFRPPEDIPRLLEAVAAVRAGRHRVPIERAGQWRHRRRDGSIVQVEIASHMVDFEGRKAELVLAHDVTARMRAEAALEESRARLSGIIDSAMDAIITTDAHEDVVLFNRAAEAMFGWRSEEIRGRRIDVLIPERFREAHRGFVDRFVRTGVTSRRMGTTGGIVGLRAGGEQFPAEASISHVITPSGSFLTVILRDVTERKRAEAELAESRHRLQLAVESAHLGFWDWDLASNRIFFSLEWRRQLGDDAGTGGDDPEEFRQRAHPEDRDRLDRVRTELIDRVRTSAEFEMRMLHKNGSYRFQRSTVALIRNESGMPLRLIGTSIDITPIRDAERTVRRLSGHILRLQDAERRRIARELHDTTAQNLAALNMNLARLARAIGQAGSPHSGLIEDSIALADVCVQEVRTLSYLLHPPLLDEFGLARAVEDYVAGFSTRSGIHVQLEVAPDLGRLPDEVELSLFRVLQESLGNVHKHSGSDRATIRLAREAKEVVLEVRDSGRGIPPEQLERLRNRAALGVGVSGMAERIAQLGGELEIDSGPDGTVVRAHVPC